MISIVTYLCEAIIKKDKYDWLKDYAAYKLRKICNQSWKKEGEPDISHEEFKARLKYEDVNRRGKNAEYFFNDGGLFWGHTVIVMCKNNKPVDATVAG